MLSFKGKYQLYNFFYISGRKHIGAVLEFIRSLFGAYRFGWFSGNDRGHHLFCLHGLAVSGYHYLLPRCNYINKFITDRLFGQRDFDCKMN